MVVTEYGPADAEQTQQNQPDYISEHGPADCPLRRKLARCAERTRPMVYVISRRPWLGVHAVRQSAEHAIELGGD